MSETDRTPADPVPRNVLLGTAGHVDHGKTRLVARLTGIDTDRLPEEKSRGISIDLGFAHWEHAGFRFGVVDVPGHERFVRTMVAGAAGIDVGLLVVAADDGVMPQTREHLDVMQLLGVRVGVVAITKIDIADEETVELVAEEIRELVDGTFLENADVVPVSAVSGHGFDQMRNALIEAAGDIEQRRTDGPFRLTIDRVFTLQGHGTIVTGSTLRGKVEAGDQLELLPPQLPVRVRSVESHGEELGSSGASTRTALNLTGLSRDSLERGMEVATPGFLAPTRRLVVRLRVVPGSPIPIANRSEHRLHIGTNECTARVVLRGGPLHPGDESFAELRLREPVVAEYGQHFLLRRASPASTIAGGVVLDPSVADRSRIRDLDAYAAALDVTDSLARTSAVCSRLDVIPVDLGRLVARMGITESELAHRIDQLSSIGELVALTDGARVHRDQLAEVRRGVVRAVENELPRHHPKRTIPRETVLKLGSRIASPPVVEAAMRSAVERSELVIVGRNLGLPGDAPTLSRRERATLDTALAAIAEGGMSPPTLRELAALVDDDEESLRKLLITAEELGELVGISAQLWLPPAILGRYVALCEDMMNRLDGVTLSNLRETWGVTRKWAVPVAEHLDAIGVTVREGDVRRPAAGRDA